MKRKPRPKHGRKPHARRKTKRPSLRQRLRQIERLRKKRKRGAGNAPTVQARVQYGIGGGLLIDFEITKNGSAGPEMIEAWAKGSASSGPIPLPATPSDSYFAGDSLLDAATEVQYRNGYRNIGAAQKKCWVWARVWLDDGTASDYTKTWTLTPDLPFEFVGMNLKT